MLSLLPSLPYVLLPGCFTVENLPIRQTGHIKDVFENVYHDTTSAFEEFLKKDNSVLKHLKNELALATKVLSL